MKLASKEGQLFAYVPDFYLDSLVEICTALRTYIHPTAPIENIEGTVLSLFMFPCVKVSTVLHSITSLSVDRIQC